LFVPLEPKGSIVELTLCYNYSNEYDVSVDFNLETSKNTHAFLSRLIRLLYIIEYQMHTRTFSPRVINFGV